MLNELKKKNPGLNVIDVHSEEFSTYGRIITGMDTAEIIAQAQKIKNPDSGSMYLPSVDAFERLDIAEKIETQFFGESKTQVGYCWGYNRVFGATEWHTSSEINIAVTPLVIIVGHIWDVKNNTVDTSKFEVFYVPAGTVLECYATTLHYCPCQVGEQGFGWVVALPEGTNTALDGEYDDKLLWAKNKWLIAHTENTSLIEDGAVAGVTGTNFKIEY